MDFDSNVAFLADDLAGRHEFKVGYQYSRVANDVDTGYVPFGIVSLSYGLSINDLTGRNDPLTPGAIGAGVVQRFGTVGAAANTANSIYFQDRWQPTYRLTINAGVRMEKEDLPSFNGFAPPIKFGCGDKIVPRLGAAFDLTGDGHTKLFGSYNKFQDRLKFELPRGSFGGDFFRNDYFEIMPNQPNYDFYTLSRILGSNQDVLGGQCPIPNSTGLSRCQYDFRIASNDPNADIYTGKVDPDLKPFTQTEFTAGLERELTNRMLLSVRYTRKDVDHAVEDAGFPTAEGSEAYIIGNPGEGLHAATAQQFGYAKTTTPQRLYNAFETRIERRFGGNFALQRRVHVQPARGQLLGSRELGRVRSHLARRQPLLRPAAPGLHGGRRARQRPARHGPSARLQRVRPVHVELGREDQATNFAAFTTLQSGTPQTSLFSFYNVATILAERGDLGRTEKFAQTDFAVNQRFKLGNSERYEVNFLFNVLNVFNNASPLNAFTQTVGTGTVTGATLNYTPSDEVSAINRLLTQGILNDVNSYINSAAAPQRRNTAVGLTNNFQGGRSIRLGVRFTFSPGSVRTSQEPVRNSGRALFRLLPRPVTTLQTAWSAKNLWQLLQPALSGLPGGQIGPPFDGGWERGRGLEAVLTSFSLRLKPISWGSSQVGEARSSARSDSSLTPPPALEGRAYLPSGQAA